MATLNWIGKEAVVNYDKEVPFKLLEKVPGASVGKESKNLIIHGDNLEALKALMPFYKGKVKCIYIDPPYNTGNEGWVYNDKVNSPKIREWLKKVVGAEGEDLTRHDKWLCMMYPRLVLLRELLSNDGAIFISMDHNELHNLLVLMNEIFGELNFVTQIEWQKRYTRSNNTNNFTSVIEHVVVYRKSAEFQVNLLARNEDANARFTNPDNDPRGPWKATPFLNQVAPDRRPNLCYPITNPVTKQVTNPTKKAWRYEKSVYEKLLNDNRLYWGKSKDRAVPDIKTFLSEVRQGMTPINFWDYDYAGHTDFANQEIKQIFGQKVFDTPKPTTLIKRILEHATNKNAIVLDSFAGSGTTGHAVMDMNNTDGGTRQFILVEVEDAVAKKITAERVKRAIKKNKYKDGFEYCELRKPLFDASGMINEACTYDELAAYIYFTETQMNIDKKKVSKPFIGTGVDRDFYLIYAGKGKNDLTRAALAKMKIRGKAVVYADRCLVDEQELAASGITFKQIPYEIILY